MAEAMTDAAALALVGSLRDLRVQIEISNGLAVQQRADLAALREELRRLSDRVACVDEAVDRVAVAWQQVVALVRPEGDGADPSSPDLPVRDGGGECRGGRALLGDW